MYFYKQKFKCCIATSSQHIELVIVFVKTISDLPIFTRKNPTCVILTDVSECLKIFTSYKVSEVF